MSLTVPWRGSGQHRGKTPAQLRRELDKATCDLVALATRLYEVTAERNRLEAQLDDTGIELSGTCEDLAAANRKIQRLLAANRAWQARYDNEHAMSDLNVETVPHGTDVRELRQQFGPVVRVAPVTDPGQTSWAAQCEAEDDDAEDDPNDAPNPPYDLPEGDWR
jgi:hypothetical protein